MPYDDMKSAASLVAAGGGGLVTSIYADDKDGIIIAGLLMGWQAARLTEPKQPSR